MYSLVQYNKNNKEIIKERLMQFGPLTTYQKMEKYYNSMRAVSRAELLSSIYKGSSNINQTKIQSQLSQAFTAIMSNSHFNTKSTLVQQIMNLFNIKKVQLEGKSFQELQTYLHQKILSSIQHTMKKSSTQFDTIEYQLVPQNFENHEFDWIGVKSNFPNLRNIFQQILLQKVRQFDDQLSRLTQRYSFNEKAKQQLLTTSRTLHSNSKVNTTRAFTEGGITLRTKTYSTMSARNIQKDIEKKGFTNVLIRDHSQFSLKKWTKTEEKQFQRKKNEFKVNFKKNGKQSPIIFQFVKKYTNTVKARDNIFQKWENREKNGINPQQLKYLCSTSLFLNQTLNKSEKQRLNRNIKSLGKDLISKLQFNIAQKIIQTYKQFMKKVSDLRAHYYQDLTKKRKIQQKNYKQNQQKLQVSNTNKQQFLKFKLIFQRICNSQKMKIILNPRVFRWVKLFINNLKTKYETNNDKKLYEFQKRNVFQRLLPKSYSSQLIINSKLKHPSARIIKREDIGNLRQPMKKYIPTQRFFYQKSFQNRIKQLNSVKVKNQRSFHKQISGGPNKIVISKINVNLGKKQIVLTSSLCLNFIIKIQTKWRSFMMRKKYLSLLQDKKKQQQKDFNERVKSLQTIYRFGAKINLKAIQERLKRVSMRTLNVLKPYERTYKKPINNYTSFSKINFSLAQLKIKQAKNSSRRLSQFGKMVQLNQFNKLMKSGFVVTSKQINEPMFKDGASAMWWAVKNSNADLSRIFLQGGGNPNSHNSQNSTCLHQAMQNGALQIIFLLLDYGADLNLKNNKKVTPLYYATPKMLKWLGLEEGATNHNEGFKDNNREYFMTPSQQNFYLDHYY